MNRLRILAIAYACNPTRGSEFGVGWGWVHSIAAGHDVTVLTADYNRDDIDSYLEGSVGPTGNIPRFIYIRNRPWHYRPRKIWLKIEGSLAKPLVNFAYQNWLEYAFEEAKREVAKNSYDLVHLITYVGWRFPGRFYQLGIPFVWGPIGGMKNTPWRLLHLLGFRGALYYGARNVVNSLQLKTLHGPRRALRAADKGVIAATSEIQEELWRRFRTKSRVICEVGRPSIAATDLEPRAETEPFRVCWSGMHLPGKALHLLLRAAAQLPAESNYTIEILGDGPCNRAWRALASRLRINDRCHWHGWLARDQSLAVMKDSHVFVITSLKDLTSNVAVEAISLGLPVVCMNHCGFADLVSDDCGIKIHPGFSDQIISDFSNALSKLYRDESLRRALARGSLRRGRDYSWPNKMMALDRVYAEVIHRQEEECQSCSLASD
jgi:glycosyltransferase involved in cell wall biosynthesis